MKPAKRVSVAEAKDRLPALIHEAEERGAAIEITRRGEVVAVLLSRDELERQRAPKKTLVERLEAIRKDTGKGGGFTKKEIASLRDDIPPSRELSFEED